MESHQPRQEKICTQDYLCPQCTQINNCLLGKERKLIRRIKMGDEDALIEFLTMYEKPIRSQIEKRGIPQQDVEVLVSNVFDFILDHIRGFEWRGISPRNWISTITRRKCLEYQRYIKTDLIENSLSLDGLSFNHEGFYLTNQSEATTPPKLERDRKIHEAIEMLPKKYRDIIMLIYFEGIDNSRTIANLLTMKPGTVRLYHKRALGKLALLLSTHQ